MSDDKAPDVPPPGGQATPEHKFGVGGAGQEPGPQAEGKPGDQALLPSCQPDRARLAGGQTSAQAPPPAGAAATPGTVAAVIPPASAAPAAGQALADSAEGGQTPEVAEAPAPAAPLVAVPGQPTLVVRYGAMGLLGRFIHSLPQWRCGQKVVIKSERGQEFGTVLCRWDGCGAPEGIPADVKGEVLRLATHNDLVEERHLLEDQHREFAFCKDRIGARSLPMKLVVAEHLFGGDRIVFYFLSETRVDFRALVRDLAQEYRTRIEMRQIGVRDEARLLGDYERCGRPLCCRAWIKELQPVSMKMAKLQKATLDPTKISGRCGRLMCCLRFEDATYRELAQRLPRKNTYVRTAQGVGRVIDSDVVTQIVALQLEDGKRANVPIENVLERDVAPPPAGEGAGRPGEGSARPEGPAPAGHRPSGRTPDRRPEEPRQRPPEARPEGPALPAADRPAPGPPAILPARPGPAGGRPGETPAPVEGPPGPSAPAPAGQPAGGPGGSRRRRRRNRRRSRHGHRPEGAAPAQGGPPGTPPQASSNPQPSGGGPGSPRDAGAGGSPRPEGAQGD